jgi:hypothetical protein
LQGLERLVNDIDRSYFRPLQQKSFLCQARCCDSSQTQADLRNWCDIVALLILNAVCSADCLHAGMNFCT